MGSSARSSASEGSPRPRWIIDPIDGTKNFIRRIPIWAVLIGLEERGEVTTGVVFNPVIGELCWAAAGRGRVRGTASASASRRARA